MHTYPPLALKSKQIYTHSWQQSEQSRFSRHNSGNRCKIMMRQERLVIGTGFLILIYTQFI